MIPSWVIHAAALAGFCRLYGVKARPEDLPREWRRICLDTRAELEGYDNDDV